MNKAYKPQLPGDVLIALRESNGFLSDREFSDTLPMSHTTLWRLESVLWGTPPFNWSRPMKRSDLDAFVQAGWIEIGDTWWDRFLTAFAWQHVVLKYGESIYSDNGASLRILAPISVEHVLAMAEALVAREVARRLGQSAAIAPDEQQALIDKLYAELVLRLSTMDCILTCETDIPITPDMEQTRSVAELLAGGAQAETPYTRTLFLAYEWGSEALAGMLGEVGDQ